MSDEKKANPVWLVGDFCFVEEWELLRDEQGRLIKSPEGYCIARRVKKQVDNTKEHENDRKA